ncbi:MAG: tetratricopeptide repeat protein, partial [Endomicrobiales bacterium]
MNTRTVAVVVMLSFLALELSAAPLAEMKALFAEGNSAHQKGNLVVAAEKLERGLRMAQRGKAGRQEQGFLLALGAVHADLGDLNKAVFYLTEALHRAQRLNDGKAVTAALMKLGAVHARRGEERRAVSFYRDALRTSREFGAQKDTGSLCRSLGAIYADLGAGLKAAGYLSDAFRILGPTATKQERYTMLALLGETWAELREYEKSLDCWKEALTAARRGKDDAPARAALAGTGRAEAGLGRYPEAAGHLEEAMQAALSAGEMTAALENAVGLGDVYRRMGAPERAAACLDAVRTAAEKAGDKITAGDAVLRKGALCARMLDWSGALSCYSEAAQLRREAGLSAYLLEKMVADVCFRTGDLNRAEEKYLLLGDLTGLGRVKREKKKYREAAELFQRALKSGSDRKDAGAVFSAHAGLGRAYRALREGAKAEENLRRAVEVFDENGGFAAEDGPRATGEETVVEPLEELVLALAERGAAGEAFMYAERIKAQLFSESAAAGAAEKEIRKMPPELRREEDITASRILILEKELGALSRSMMAEECDNVRGELEKLRERSRKLVSGIRASYPEYAWFRHPVPLTAADIPLAADEVLLEFSAAADKTCLFVIDGKSGELKTKLIPLSREKLGELVRSFRETLAQGEKNAGPYDPRKGKELYKLLFDGALERFPEGITLVMVPDAGLGAFPFEALPAGKKSGG